MEQVQLLGKLEGNISKLLRLPFSNILINVNRVMVFNKDLADLSCWHFVDRLKQLKYIHILKFAT